MTTLLTEETRGGKLSFEFSDKWQVYKYDEQAPGNFYEQIKGCGDLKAVDFIAISDKNILLIEVKYITATNENSMMRFSAIPSEKETFLLKQIKEKLTVKEEKLIKISFKRPYLATEIAKKVKDTLVGLCASYRRCDKNLQPYSQSLFVDNKAIIVILFLEREGNLNQPAQFKPLATNLKKAIEQKINFLGNIRIDVINTLTIPPELKIQVLNHNT
jgi:hypothetical protein